MFDRNRSGWIRLAVAVAAWEGARIEFSGPADHGEDDPERHHCREADESPEPRSSERVTKGLHPRVNGTKHHAGGVFQRHSAVRTRATPHVGAPTRIRSSLLRRNSQMPTVVFVPNDPLAVNGPPQRNVTPGTFPAGAKFTVTPVAKPGTYQPHTPQYDYWQPQTALIPGLKPFAAVDGK